MAQDAQASLRLETLRTYFRRVDAADPALMDLFTDDVEFFFPKFGAARGKAAIAAFGQRMAAHLAEIGHDIEGLNFIVAGDRIAVEGREWGVTHAGRRWPDGVVSQGRFCGVFEFAGAFISRISIYVDPDFASEDKDRIDILRGP